MGETTRYATILDTPNEIGWFRFLAGYQALHMGETTREDAMPFKLACMPAFPMASKGGSDE